MDTKRKYLKYKIKYLELKEFNISLAINYHKALRASFNIQKEVSNYLLEKKYKCTLILNSQKQLCEWGNYSIQSQN